MLRPKYLSLVVMAVAILVAVSASAAGPVGDVPQSRTIAATGIANVWEIATHLRGEAGDRQIKGAKIGLAHVIGLGSACGVHILEKPAA